jgi:hypothetical protein
MSFTVKRRLTILDAMALVAFSALALVAGRLLVPDLVASPSSWGSAILRVAFWVILGMTLALIPLRLCYPHPSIDRLSRQPGWLACSAVGLTVAIGTLQQVMSLGPTLTGATGPSFQRIITLSFTEAVYALPNQAVIAVAAAWGTLALASAWEPDGSWIDRSGRTFGAFWLAYPVLERVVSMLPAW